MLAPETLKLPSFRVSCNHIFENEGVDYARPLYHKELFNNTVTMSKCYILLFTCAVIRAVHIELTPDMGAHSLILALCRFISRKSRSEEHTSELQSLTNLVCRLLLEKKNKMITIYSI